MAFNNNQNFSWSTMVRYEKSVTPLSETNFGTQKKRRLEEVDCFQTKENRGTYIQEDLPVPVTKQQYPRHFINIPGSQWSYHTDEWKNKQTTIFTPLCGDIMLNTQTVEQISFDSGMFHIGNEQNVYKESTEGQVIHLWKYDSSMKKLYIFRSFLFTNSQVYSAIQRQLGEL